MEITHPLLIPRAIKEYLAQSALRDVPLVRSFPKSEITGPEIVCRLVRRDPGSENVETKGSRLRAEIPVSDDEVQWVFGQAYTSLVEFNILHNSDDEADDLTMAFEAFIREIRPDLQQNGVTRFLFEEQLPDNYLQLPKDIPNRTLRYAAHMSVLHSVSYTRIRQIQLSVTYGAQYDAMTLTRASNGLSDEIDKAYYTIIGLYKDERSTQPDYIADVDYKIECVDDYKSKLTWLTGGLKPEAGTDYLVRYTKPSSEFDPRVITADTDYRLMVRSASDF